MTTNRMIEKLNQTTFQFAPVNNHQTTIAIVGDDKQSLFYPQVKLQHWDNEANFSIRLKEEIHQKSVTLSKDSIHGHNKRKSKLVKFYEVQDGFEFEIIFTEKPESNVVEFTYQTKLLDAFYQGPLTQEEINKGCYRPDNVVGSYAFYHSTKKDNEYGCGKAFHFYRPKAIDVNNVEVWCDLNIDPVSGLITITVPQDFLDNASYPIIVDPTLGSASAGATSINIHSGYPYYTNNAGAIGLVVGNPSQRATLDSIYVYCGTPNEKDHNYINHCLWRSDTYAVVKQHGFQVLIPQNGAGWAQCNISVDLYPAISYLIGGVFGTDIWGGSTLCCYYDSSTTNISLIDNNNTVQSAKQFTADESHSWRFSTYISFTYPHSSSSSSSTSMSSSSSTSFSSSSTSSSSTSSSSTSNSSSSSSESWTATYKLYEYQHDIGAYYPGNVTYAQTFIASSNHVISRIVFRLSNHYVTTGNFTVSIRKTSGGVPVGPNLATASIPCLDIGRPNDYYIFNLNHFIKLLKGHAYAMVFSSPFTDDVEYIVSSGVNDYFDEFLDKLYKYVGGSWVDVGAHIYYEIWGRLGG